MPYVPPPTLTAAALTDGAGGSVSTTIAAAPAAYSQSDENNARSSLVATYATLRARASSVVGSRGGGYRPVPSVASLTIASAAADSTTIASANAAVHAQANEDAFRYNFGRQVNALAVDVTALKATCAPRSAVTRLTDAAGGSANGSVSSAAAAYSQANEQDDRAEFVTKLNEIANALGV